VKFAIIAGDRGSRKANPDGEPGLGKHSRGVGKGFSEAQTLGKRKSPWGANLSKADFRNAENRIKKGRSGMGGEE